MSEYDGLYIEQAAEIDRLRAELAEKERELAKLTDALRKDISGCVVGKDNAALRKLCRIAGTCGVCASRSYMKCPVVEESRKPEYAGLFPEAGREGIAKPDLSGSLQGKISDSTF